MCVLSSDAVLWKKYPTGKPEDGQSYRAFKSGEPFTIVGEYENRGQYFTYVLDLEGATYVSPTEYLTYRVRIMT
jgi:hypothetical protein